MYGNEEYSEDHLAKLFRLSVKSLIYNKINKGPSADNWDTPALTRPESDYALFTNTNRLLSLNTQLGENHVNGGYVDFL